MEAATPDCSVGPGLAHESPAPADQNLMMLALLPMAMWGLAAGFNHLRREMRLDWGMETQPAV